MAGVDTPAELASFLAQVNQESGGLTQFDENLDYSAERLPQVWKRFAVSTVDENNHPLPLALRRPNDLAFRYAHNPKALGSFVYANILGNGDEASGDGWAHRGMGCIQLTGKANHDRCGNDIGRPLRYHPELLLVADVGVAGALWYWTIKHLDLYDDDADAVQETKIVTGGTIGLAQRQAFLRAAMEILTDKVTT